MELISDKNLTYYDLINDDQEKNAFFAAKRFFKKNNGFLLKISFLTIISDIDQVLITPKSYCLNIFIDESSDPTGKLKNHV
jgi:hypothetical protein